jgi:hypothetical protein
LDQPNGTLNNRWHNFSSCPIVTVTFVIAKRPYFLNIDASKIQIVEQNLKKPLETWNRLWQKHFYRFSKKKNKYTNTQQQHHEKKLIFCVISYPAVDFKLKWSNHQIKYIQAYNFNYSKFWCINPDPWLWNKMNINETLHKTLCSNFL